MAIINCLFAVNSLFVLFSLVFCLLLSFFVKKIVLLSSSFLTF